MASLDDLMDSTDWLATPLAGLGPVESSLRCQVCKDFFQTPMMTSCSHTFCSLCIRRYLSQEGRCPACRESDQEIKLRRNWAVEEMVTQFIQARPAVLGFARRAKERDDNALCLPPKKRRKLESQTDGVERRNTRSQSKNITASQGTVDSVVSREEVDDSDDGGSSYRDEDSSKKEPHNGRVACPSCARQIKESLINSHLDRCLAGEASSPPRSVSGTPIPQAQLGSLVYSQTKPSAQKDRLPTLNYSMFTESSMRKKLKELGIINTGSKELMRKRHTEWVNLWNSNCDAKNPKTKRELLRELDIWERTLGRQVDRGTSGVMVKEFDRDNWQKSNRDEFNDLIRQARQKRIAKVADFETDGTADINGQRGQNRPPNLAQDTLPSDAKPPTDPIDPLPVSDSLINSDKIGKSVTIARSENFAPEAAHMQTPISSFRPQENLS